ncbi:hypothetical protein LK429_00340 [Hoylesella buccalis]|uniref:hypothetical protein n=1 Tax=Hoylesella buccalis TaxID=28127 RepID=UPI001D155C7B|nr:hypothetical protein [Hoylesella buccalis]UEA63074.1 hypothetical protein LK429_00340 [Hoylesella buccalis]UWP49636.1 hypothetical protein NQ518_00775 [Hoylesella buccalis ATCC 35310]
MKAKVIKTGKIVDVISIIDRLSGCFISYLDSENRKEYSRFELDFNVGAQMKGVQINNETVKPIDWEQRRYEIARDIMVASFDQPMSGASVASHVHNCILWADDLIKELKKESK